MKQSQAKKLNYLLTHLLGTNKNIEECIKEIDRRVGQCDSTDKNFEQEKKEICREVTKQYLEEGCVTDSQIETYLCSHPCSYPKSVREKILSETDKLLDNLVEQLWLTVEKVK